MEDKKNLEGENLNGDNQEGTGINQDNSDKGEEKKTFTKEEVEEIKKKLASDTERGVQKLAGEKKLYQEALKEIANIGKDSKRLVEISEDNPALAKILLNDYFGGISIEEYSESIGYEKDYTDPKIIKSTIEKESRKLAEKMKQESFLEAEIKEFVNKLKMTEEEKQNFTQIYTKMSEAGIFKDKSLNKQFETAYRLGNDNEESISKLRQAEIIGNTLATSGGKTTNKMEDKSLANEVKALKAKLRIK